eukprot:3055139-Pyramimonas_sp.AAC.1
MFKGTSLRKVICPTIAHDKLPWQLLFLSTVDIFVICEVRWAPQKKGRPSPLGYLARMGRQISAQAAGASASSGDQLPASRTRPRRSDTSKLTRGK